MKKVFKPSRELVTLVAGVILVIAGIVGGLIIFNLNGNDPSKENYFATETVLAARAVQKTAQSGGNQTQPQTQATIAKSVKGYALDFSQYYVHADPTSGLETPSIPDKIVIPAIELDAPVVVADFNYTDVEGETFGQWMAPSEYAAGWHPSSALLGQIGNTVINGHHNEYGKVFGKLVDLKIGDEIDVYSKGRKYAYVISNKMTLLELTQNLETRLNNARWLAKSDDERLTLVTCWPPLSNTYRVIIVARPLETGN